MELSCSKLLVRVFFLNFIKKETLSAVFDNELYEFSITPFMYNTLKRELV